MMSDARPAAAFVRGETGRAHHRTSALVDGGPHRAGMPLTPTQWRILRLRAMGLTATEIAAIMPWSRRSVTRNATEAFARLGVTSIVDAFLALGWIHVPDEVEA